jgi:outer membrane receptor protein involved in Fe transport
VGSFGFHRALLVGSTPLGHPPGEMAPAEAGPRLLSALELEQGNGPWTSPEKLRKLNGLLRLSDGSGTEGWSIDANLYAAHWDSTDQVPLQLIQSGQLGHYSALDPTDGGDTGRAILSGEWHRHDELGYSRVSAYVEHYRLQLWSDFTFFELRPSTGDQFEQEEQRNIVGGEAVHGWMHRLLGRDSLTEIGVQLRSDRIRVGLNTEARVPFATVSNNDVGETELGAYVQNTTHWTPWLRTLVGLREDYIQMNMTAIALPQNSGRASGSRLSPKVSLILGPWQRTEVFVNAGHRFHSNDARGVIDKIDPTTGLPVSAVPALVASRGAELGLRTEITPGLQSSLALWWLNSDSEIVYSADSAIGSTSANGASKRYGLEWNTTSSWTTGCCSTPTCPGSMPATPGTTTTGMQVTSFRTQFRRWHPSVPRSSRPARGRVGS